MRTADDVKAPSAVCVYVLAILTILWQSFTANCRLASGRAI
ncbi:hypothetical protein CAMSH0001_0784 [Campylobacter showae RM3277]|uniref:Uncharacterized protein n=1 Tax=Campylobacter showae RM3277 TaxID=553219 RepID=C6RHF7_9BACT|nr:hypothetical protein CAMSH0001_0784 [Campylobacter showae RM3277]